MNILRLSSRLRPVEWLLVVVIPALVGGFFISLMHQGRDPGTLLRLAEAYAKGHNEGFKKGVNEATEHLMPVVLAAYQQGQRDGPDESTPGAPVRCLRSGSRP